MAHFILGVLLSLPCDDPYESVESVMKSREGEGKIDGWDVIELQWSRKIDATPYAYIALDGSWHERAEEGSYPEEQARSQQIRTFVKEHLEQYGESNFPVLRQRFGEVPQAVTDWHRTWQRVTHENRCIVAFVWCHV